MFIGQKILYSHYPQTFADPLCLSYVYRSQFLAQSYPCLLLPMLFTARTTQILPGVPSSICSLGLYCNAKANAMRRAGCKNETAPCLCSWGEEETVLVLCPLQGKTT